MNCERANEVLMLELYGEAAAADAAELHAHLAECADCRLVAESSRAALEEFRRAPEPSPSREVVASIIEEAQPRPALIDILRRLRPALWQAAAVLVIAAAISASMKLWPQKTTPTVTVATTQTSTYSDFDTAWNSDASALADKIRLARADAGFDASVDSQISSLRNTLLSSQTDTFNF